MRAVSVFAVALIFTGTASAASPAVEEVRVQSHAGFTRVILETTAPVAPNLFTMGGPNRLVIDLPELDWNIPRETGVIDNTLIRKYSFGLFQPGVSRLVLELSGPTRVLGRGLSRYGNIFTYRIDLANLPPSAPTLSDLPPAATVDRATKSVFEARRFDPDTAEFDRLTDALAAAIGDAAKSRSEDEPIETTALNPEGTPDLAPRTPETPSPETPAPEVQADPEETPEIRIEPPRAPLRIVLDPGHGGRDPGTGSGSGVKEKDINLAFAEILARLLEVDENYEVFLTRERDKSLRLPDRVSFARRKNADLFISIHADWNQNPRVKGATAYTLSEEASVEALDTLTTQREDAGTVAGVDLAAQREDIARLLVDLARRDTQARSMKFAELVVAEVAKETPVLRRPLRRDSFHVLKAPDMPSVLLELGFLSNDADRELLQSEVWQLKTAEAVKRAIDSFRQATGARRFENR